MELTGNATDNDSLKLVEVANQKNTDTGANRAPAGVLSIVEAEFYQLKQD
jgi:beta-galactosidase